MSIGAFFLNFSDADKLRIRDGERDNRLQYFYFCLSEFSILFILKPVVWKPIFSYNAFAD